jgi:hypothetical protein
MTGFEDRDEIQKYLNDNYLKVSEGNPKTENVK